MVKKCSMRYSMIALAGGKRESQSYCLSIPLTHHNKSAGGGVNSHAHSTGNRFKNIPTLINLIPHGASINVTRFGKWAQVRVDPATSDGNLHRPTLVSLELTPSPVLRTNKRFSGKHEGAEPQSSHQFQHYCDNNCPSLQFSASINQSSRCGVEYQSVSSPTIDFKINVRKTNRRRCFIHNCG